MKLYKPVISTQPQHPPVPAPDTSVALKHGSRPAPVSGHPAAAPELPALPDQPFLSSSTQIKDDPFSYLPPIYNPDANFVVESAQSEISELLPPETDGTPTQ